MENKETAVIKIGTESILNEKGFFDIEKPKVKQMIEDINALIKANVGIMLVSSGAVGLGKAIIGKEPEGVDKVKFEQFAAGIGQSELIAKYKEAFERFNIPVFQLLTTHADFHNESRKDSILTSMKFCFENKILPIVNENDPLTKEELLKIEKIADNDNLALHMARLIRARAIYIITNTNGVYSGDPKDPKSIRIPYISEHNIGLYLSHDSGKSNNGTGGMHSKLRISKQAIENGIEVHILDGKTSTIKEHYLGTQIGGTLIKK